MIIAVLAILSSAFLARSISENRLASGYADSANAFWIAEGGLNQAYYNWANNSPQPTGAVDFNGGTYTIDTSGLPIVSVTGAYGNSQRTLQASFIRVATPFENMLSIGGDLTLSAIKSTVNVGGKTRISGAYIDNEFRSNVNFADMQTGTGQEQTTIPIPDYNNNGVTNEFADFVQLGDKAIADYPADQVIHIETNGTVVITPNSALEDIRVIFVEGPSAGQGDVDIIFDGSWAEGEELTVISTGSVNFIEPLQIQNDSRLSVIAYDDYTETNVLISQRDGIVYSKNSAKFMDLLDTGSFTGNVITNGGLRFQEVVSNKSYIYSDAAKNGDFPPGFQWLAGSGTSGTPKLMDWQE